MYWLLLHIMYSENFGFGAGGFRYSGYLYMNERITGNPKWCPTLGSDPEWPSYAASSSRPFNVEASSSTREQKEGLS